MTIKSETRIASRKGCDIFKTLEEAKAYIYKRWHLAVNDVRPNAKGGE